jgi:hypothetical protein
MPKHNSREEAEYKADVKEQDYILKTIDEFTFMNEEERKNLWRVYAYFKYGETNFI